MPLQNILYTVNCSLFARELGLGIEGLGFKFLAYLCEVWGFGFVCFLCFGTGARQKMWSLRLHGKAETLGVVNALSKQVSEAQRHLGGMILFMLTAKI